MENLNSIIEMFQFNETILDIETYGSGHINRTYTVKTKNKNYILQKINTSVFKDFDGLMKNIDYVTKHLMQKGIETLRFLNAKNGKNYVMFEENAYRMYERIENVTAYQTITDEHVFENAGFAFGNFTNDLADFDANLLKETIVDFHNTPKRYLKFESIVKENPKNRLSLCKEEVDFVFAHKNTLDKVVNGIKNGNIPLRVTHNDTKLNNILMDNTTNKARVVIDLDTVMPGSLLYDFGDAIRFGASTAAEDEKDLNLVHFSKELYYAFARGYLKALKNSITQEELSLLPYSAYLMTIECGMRFLTDYLEGDVYFGIHYEDHNLVRARTQLKLAYEMENCLEELKKKTVEIFQNL